MNFKQRLDRYLTQSDDHLLPDDDDILIRESLEFAGEFSINSYGIIDSPGKFEGECQYVPYYYNLLMHSCQDEDLYENRFDDIHYSLFIVTDKDRESFPELQDVKVVSLWESSMGFVFADLDANFEDLR